MISFIAALATFITTLWTLELCVGVFGENFCQLSSRDTRILEGVWRGAAAVHQELWLFAGPGILINTVDHWHGDATKALIVLDALTLFNWWYFRNWPDENRWKRRGKKAAAAVAERAGRLVVVPVPEQS